MTLRASIVINTYNRRGLLERLLASLAHLTGPPFEVVVVNGPSSDDTQAFLDSRQGEVKVARCLSRNLSESRNIGIETAAGDIICFIDDDALPADERWIERFIEAFENDTQGAIGACGGPVIRADTPWFEFDGGATADYGEQIFHRRDLSAVKIDGIRWALRAQGCNCAFRRSALLEIGGFDEYYQYYHDETDVCLRLARSGWATLDLAENVVRHYPASSERRRSEADRNWFVTARSDGYFGAKNGADGRIRRAIETARRAPRKHYVVEITRYLRTGTISLRDWARYIGQMSRGFATGIAAGFSQPRRTRTTWKETTPFVPFAQVAPSPRLRIALVSQDLPGQQGAGGVGRYTAALARGLHELGHRVHVVCRADEAVRRERLNLTIHGITQSDEAGLYSDEQRPILSKNLSHSLAVRTRLTEIDSAFGGLDVAHASNWDAELMATIRAGDIPSVLTLVTPLSAALVSQGWDRNPDMDACLAVDRWQCEEADALTAPTEGALSAYAGDLSEPSTSRCSIVPLGIVLDDRPNAAPAKEARILLFTGRVEKRKGAHVLLEVLPELLARHPEWECHLVGDDTIPQPGGLTLKESFFREHASAPWRTRVVFHGYVSEGDLADHYRRADVFVAPSRFESFGLMYLEAMQYGVPVVGCDAGGIREVVQNDETGLLVPPSDPSALLEALERLLSDDMLRSRLGRAGRARAAEHGNHRAMARRFESVYQRAIACARERNGRQRPPRTNLLFDEARFDGEWSELHSASGRTLLVGHADARAVLTVPGGSRLKIVARRGPGDGILDVGVGSKTPRPVDLFSESDEEFIVSLDVDGPTGTTVVTHLRVHPEKNPLSRASRIRLQGAWVEGPSGR